MELREGDRLHGFTVHACEELPEIGGRALRMRHDKSGARLLYLANGDDNKAFSISFKTPPTDDTGVFHILEHSVLCGSRKFPVKEPFVNLLKSSMQTFLNAMTFPDKTMYPVASTNMQDLLNLADVYMDAVLHPNIYVKPEIFMQEGWHYELARNAAAGVGEPTGAEEALRENLAAGDVELACNGVVYNEMKGALSEPSSALFDLMQASLFPDTAYRFESGGTPQAIPDLTYERFLEEHRRHYRLDNSYIVLYGDLDPDRMLAFLDGDYLSPEADEQARRDEDRAAAGLAPLAPDELAEQAAVVNMGARKTMVTAPGNACCGLGYVVGTARDRTRLAALDILLDAVMGSNEAPLKRAIIDADLADDASAYLADSLLQPFAVLELRGLRDGAAARFDGVVTAELERLAGGGLDHALLEASLSRAEFVMREHDFGMADGVAYAMSSLAGWLYDDELATSYIKYEDDFAFLRRAIETDYFERLIEDAFLRSDHRCLAEVVPVSGDDDAWEEERLRAVRGTLSAQDLRRIAEDEVRLRRLQEAPDSPDALATLPHLGVADIAEAPKEHAYGLAVGAAVPCLVHEVPTRGIAYLYRYFDLSPVAFDELPYAAVLAMMLGKLPTASHTAAEIDTLVNGRLGNFGASCVVFDPADPAAGDGPNPPEGPVVRLRVSSSALDENAAFLSELVREILFETDFSDTDRIRDRLVQRRISMEQAFAASGNSFALARVGSYYRSASAIADELDGIGFYRFLVELLDRFEERREGLGEKLAELCGRIVSDERCLLSFAGDKASLSRFWDAERPSVERRRALASSAAPRLLRAPEPQQRNEAFVVPTDVCYAAMGYNLAEPADNRQLGTWLVACRALTFDYLWNEVRVKGGAYGTGFQALVNGNVRFYSYRDPHLDDTLQRFDGAVDYLESLDFGQTELEDYVVATTAGLDQPQKARGIVRRQDGDWLSGRTPRDRAELREGVVRTTVEDLRGLASPLRGALAHRAVCVFGSGDIIAKSDAVRGENPLLHSIDLLPASPGASPEAVPAE